MNRVEFISDYLYNQIGDSVFGKMGMPKGLGWDSWGENISDNIDTEIIKIMDHVLTEEDV